MLTTTARRQPWPRMCTITRTVREICLLLFVDRSFLFTRPDASQLTFRSSYLFCDIGITSDPLTQFTVVFCALIHDVDHTGVSNGQLVKEKAHIATLYKNKSVAEQNSIDLAWDLLMQDDYENLRRCIYANAGEFKRFRQLVVNTVLATDIFDKELSTLRKNRWAKAFSEVPVEEPAADTANRKATIVIEHLIQGSDVSHTMQVSFSSDD
jgi:3'5'-cyclic nucleotide phosphodiesterase